MSNQLDQAMAMVKQVCHAYLSERDISQVLCHADDQIVWIANEMNQICRGRDELKAFLQEEKQGFADSYIIKEEWYESTRLTADTCTVYGEVKLEESFEQPIIHMNYLRLSIICKLDNREPKMLHVHASMGIQGTQDGRYQSSFLAQKHVNDTLQHIIKEKTAELERVNREYRDSLTRYKFAMEVTNDVVFELDLDSKQILVDDRRFFDLFHRKPQRDFHKDTKKELLRVIHPEDRERVDAIFSTQHIMAMAQEGNEVISCEFRIQNKDTNYIWVLGQMIPIKDCQGRVVKLIGNIKNIDERVRKEIEMRQLSQKDSLTGLLNKVSTENAITSSMEQAKEKESGAMFIIDIDNFKAINDSMGHLYGDAVLSYFTAELTRIFRSTDIVGRVGGDEFLVFLLGSPSIDIVESKAAQICKIFRDSVMEEQQNYKASCSLGIALFPEQGSTYYELFKKADDALYEAKRRGKDQYCFY